MMIASKNPLMIEERQTMKVEEKKFVVKIFLGRNTKILILLRSINNLTSNKK